MLRATLRSLFARKIRLALSALAVVAGVSFVTGTLVLTDTLSGAYSTMYADITRNVSVAVRAVNQIDPGSNEGRKQVEAALVGQLAAVPGVRAAVGQVSGTAQIVDPATGKAIQAGLTPSQGINWTGDQPTATETIAEGRAPSGPGELVIDKGTADRVGLRVGQQVVVVGPVAGPQEQFTLVGTFRTAGRDSATGGVVAAFTTPEAQRLILGSGSFTAIYLAAADGVGAEELAARVSQILPDGVEAVTGAQLAEENQTAVEEGLRFLSTSLLIFAGISVFVGAFIIFNTFTMLVAQRVRELALLRAIGASRGQVRLSVQVEAALVGVVGATAGLLLGVALARGLHAVMGVFGVVLPDGELVLRARTVVVAYLVGVLVTAAAAVVPAYKAATVPPVAALRDTFTIATRSLRTRAALGLAGVTLGGAVVVLGLSGRDLPVSPAALVGGGAGVIFLGVTALSPVIAKPVTAVLGAPLPRLFGVTGRIGLTNAMRSPRRTAATASALMIGLALVSAFSVFGESIKMSVRDTVSESLGADFYLSSQGQTGFSGEVRRAVEQVPGVQTVVGIHGLAMTVRGQSELESVLAGDPAKIADVFQLTVTAGELDLPEGAIAMRATRAAELGLAVGDEVVVSYPDAADVPLRLAATFTGGGDLVEYLVSDAEWARHAAADLDLMVLVKQQPEADPAAVRAALDAAVKPFPTVTVTDQREFIAEQEKTVDQVIGMVYVLLALAVIIALFGIVNTLALSVIERTKEIGMLRAVGLSRRQMWVVVVLESVVISVFGATLGVAVGSFLGWALVKAMESQGVTSFAYPLTTILGVLLLGAVLGVVAAVVPALRAARMNVLRAIATS
ncbi:MAG: FtsX-like permease family protein [Frankia sp.]|nr:FtsX-like permease family protein [Frankia sp.]